MSAWVRATLALLVIAFIVVTAWVLAKNPVTTLTVDLMTEVVAVRVVDSDSAAFRLPAAQLEGEDGCRQRLSVWPDRGVKVTYTRFQREALRIEIDGASTLEFGPSEKRARKRYEDPIALSVGIGLCLASEAEGVRVSVNGLATFGQYQRRLAPSDEPQAPLLLSGELSVYARALPDILGLPLDAGPFRRNALYLAHQMSVPAGSVIDAPPSSNGTQARWTGFADVNFQSDDGGGLRVLAAANTARAQIYLPGANVVADKPSMPEEIALSLLARVGGDPNLQLIYGVILAFTVLISTYAAYVGLHDKPKDRNDAEPDPLPATGPQGPAGVQPRLRGELGRRRARLLGRRE